MVYTIQIETNLETKLERLRKKDNSLYQSIIHKIIEISRNPDLGKPLRNVLKGKRFRLSTAYVEINKSEAFINK